MTQVQIKLLNPAVIKKKVFSHEFEMTINFETYCPI